MLSRFLYFTFLTTNQSSLISDYTGGVQVATVVKKKKKNGAEGVDGRRRPYHSRALRVFGDACSEARNLRAIITELVNLFVYTRAGCMRVI